MKKNTESKELTISQKTTKFQKISTSAIMLTVAIITACIGLLAIGITIYFKLVINFASEKCQFKVDNIFLNLIFVCTALGLLYFVYKILPKINKKILLVITLAFSLCIGFWWVNYIKFKPMSDQSMIVYCAERFIDNKLKTILDPGEYLNRNPHQLGCVVYAMTAFKLFNTNDPLVLQNLNVIYSAVCALALYFITQKIFKESIVHKIALIFIAFFSIYWAFFSVHVYGNLPGLMFGLISFLFTLRFIDSNKLTDIFFSAITLMIAYLLKSNYEIFMCAIVITLLLNFLKIRIWQPLVGVLIIIISMVSFKAWVYHHVESGTGYSLHEGVPMNAYIYMGIAEPVTLTPGWYTADVERIYNESGFNTEKSSEMANEKLKNRVIFLLNNLDYTCDYFTNKLQTTWLNPTFQVFWCSTPSSMLDLDPAYNNRIAKEKLLISILCGTAYKIEERIMDVFQIITFLSASFALFLSFKDGDLKKLLLPITFLGGFIFHIIWETKSIYVIQYFYLLIPFAAYGIYRLFTYLDKLFKKN